MHALSKGNSSLPHGLKVQDTYMDIRDGGKTVVFIIGNCTAHPITIKKGAPITQVEMASLVPSPLKHPGTEEAPEKELGVNVQKRMMKERRKLLFEKLDLEGLETWSPKGTVAARELLAEYDDVFSLEPGELGCTTAVKHEIKAMNDTPFKERFRRILLPLVGDM